MENPEEIEVWWILPAIRRELVAALKKLGMKQKDIAKALGITESAVSQYLSNKRAKGIKFEQAVMQQIKKSAMDIVELKSNLIRETQKILDIVRKTALLCKVHKKFGKATKTCKLCKYSG